MAISEKTPCVHNQQACVAGVNGGGGGLGLAKNARNKGGYAFLLSPDPPPPIPALPRLQSAEDAVRPMKSSVLTPKKP